MFGMSIFAVSFCQRFGRRLYSGIDCFREMVHCSQGSSTGDDLDELHSNTGLTRLVVDESQLVDDLSSVLARVLHSRHTGGLLRSGVVQEGDPQVGCDVELVEGWVGDVLPWEFGNIELAFSHSLQEALSREDLQMANDSSDS